MPDLQEVFRVTTQKVRPDPGAMERQIRSQRSRMARRKAGGYAVLAAILVLGLVIGIATLGGGDRTGRPSEPDGLAPPDGGASLTVEQLQGIWYEDPGSGVWGEPVLARFEPDGSFSLGAVLDELSWLYGSYAVAGSEIEFTVTGGACGGRDVFTWEGEIVAEGRLEANFRGSGSDSLGAVGNCAIPVGEPYDFTRVSPVAPGTGQVIGGYSELGAGPVTEATSPVDLQGFWLDQETGSLLLMQWSGSYRLDAGGRMASDPQDVGSVEVGRRTLTFVTGGDAGGCSEGDVMVWTNVRMEEGRLRAEVAEDPCGRGLEGEIALLYLNVDPTV